MNENETTGTPVPETTDTPVTPVVPEIPYTPIIHDVPETTTPEVEVEPVIVAAARPVTTNKMKWIYSAIAVVVVILGFYGMEQTGKLNTGIFDGVNKALFSGGPVATVNGKSITRADFDTSVEQISTGAEVQGVDVTSPEVQADIEAQAIDMLVNTELLKQEAEVRGLEVTDEDVQARYTELVAQVGGEEALAERMKEFDVTEKTLLRDIKNELTIQTLLEQVFAEQSVSVTEEEVLELYNSAKEVTPDIPELEEVRAQIEAQIKSSKEQEVVTTFINSLREKAEIEVLL